MEISRGCMRLSAQPLDIRSVRWRKMRGVGQVLNRGRHSQTLRECRPPKKLLEKLCVLYAGNQDSGNLIALECPLCRLDCRLNRLLEEGSILGMLNGYSQRLLSRTGEHGSTRAVAFDFTPCGCRVEECPGTALTAWWRRRRRHSVTRAVVRQRDRLRDDGGSYRSEEFTTLCRLAGLGQHAFQASIALTIVCIDPCLREEEGLARTGARGRARGESGGGVRLSL